MPTGDHAILAIAEFCSARDPTLVGSIISDPHRLPPSQQLRVHVRLIRTRVRVCGSCRGALRYHLSITVWLCLARQQRRTRAVRPVLLVDVNTAPDPRPDDSRGALRRESDFGLRRGHRPTHIRDRSLATTCAQIPSRAAPGPSRWYWGRVRSSFG
jgi:hypothetical protein